MTMNNFSLKIMAIVFMLIDHIGVILIDPSLDEYLYFRLIGRLAFPIFAFLTSKSVIKTSNIKKYFIRLIIFAFLSQIVYYYIISKEQLNIFFTLIFGGLAIYLYKDNKKIATLFLITSSFFLPIDYGGFGVSLIFLFSFFDKKKVFWIFSILVTILVYYKNGLFLFYGFWIFSTLLIDKYYEKRSKYQMKYFFYWFYSGHLIILQLIKRGLN